MARKTNAALALALSALLAFGTIPAPALAEMADGTMGTEPIVATKPVNESTPAPDSELGTAPVTDPAPAPTTDPAPDLATDPALASDLTPATDPAADPATAQPDAIDLATQSLPASGTWGTCRWEIDGQGNLTVHPGTGAEPDQMTIEKSPWADYADQIKTAKFKQEGDKKVVLPQYAFALFAHLRNLTSVDLSGADSSNTKMFHWVFCDCSSLTTTDGLSALDVSKVEDMTGLFHGCSSLTSLSGISGWNCASVREMSSMFRGCASLASLDGLSKWSIPNVRVMSYMFEDCTSLASLTGISAWDVSNVTDMSSMFSGCTSLASLDGLSSWSFQNVDSVSFMFNKCTSLTSLDAISGWSFSGRTSIVGLFSGCTSLASLEPLSKWNTSEVADMSSMFSGCTSLASLGPISGWNVTKVARIASMFSGCTSLASLDPISGWNVSNLKNVRGAFKGCSSLKDVDLSGWKLSGLEYVDGVFADCSQLASLDISGWNTSNVTINQDPWYTSFQFKDMFDGCSSLSSITVGTGYDIKVGGMFPDPTGYGKWWSTKDKKWYTKDEVVSSRSRVADTYVCRAKFPDVPAGAWYEGVVYRAVGLGLLGGYSDGSGRFAPEAKISRGQVAVVLWNMAKRPAAGSGAKTFRDVDPKAYYCNAVRWASSAGVVSGYADGRFGPDDSVTREQLAVMLANYSAKVAGKPASGSAADFASMADRAKVSSWAVPAVGWCFKKGILSGSNGNVNPQGNATRAQAAKMVVYLHDLLG